VNLNEYFEAATMVLIYFASDWLRGCSWHNSGTSRASCKRHSPNSRPRVTGWFQRRSTPRLAVWQARIAHEIRNPIAMISSSLSTAKQPGMDPALCSEMFDIAAVEAQRLETFTRTSWLTRGRPSRTCNRSPWQT